MECTKYKINIIVFNTKLIDQQIEEPQEKWAKFSIKI